MKKLLAVLLAAVMLFGVVAGCSDTKPAEAKSMKIVTTIFPAYDWVKQILGDQAERADVTLLIDNGVDLHSYQPTADDIVKIADCDMFVYVGGHSDGWVKGALKQATNPDMIVVNLLDALGDKVKAEEIVDGMEHHHEHGDEDHDHEHGDDDHETADTDHTHADDHDHEATDHTHADEHDHDDTTQTDIGEHEHEHEDEHADDHDHDHDHDHDRDHDHDHEHEHEADEHVWLSLRNAEILCAELAEQLGKIDPEHADEYAENAEEYNETLADLDREYAEAVNAAEHKTLLFGDRFPFRYLVDDYGLDYYAAFSGCSAESEAAFETVTFLAGKLNELKLPAVITLEGSDQKIAETVIATSDREDTEILTLNSMQTITSRDADSGNTYLSIMTDNLDVLKQALR